MRIPFYLRPKIGLLIEKSSTPGATSLGMTDNWIRRKRNDSFVGAGLWRCAMAFRRVRSCDAASRYDLDDLAIGRQAEGMNA
jgi:hypothetical protein